MKVTGIVRRIDDSDRIVIQKKIRSNLRIQEGDPSHISLTLFDRFFLVIHRVVESWKEAVLLKVRYPCFYAKKKEASI